MERRAYVLPASDLQTSPAQGGDSVSCDDLIEGLDKRSVSALFIHADQRVVSRSVATDMIQNLALLKIEDVTSKASVVVVGGKIDGWTATEKTTVLVKGKAVPIAVYKRPSSQLQSISFPHSQHVTGLHIQISSIAGAGNGLFAASNFKTGDALCLYWGSRLTFLKLQRQKERTYVKGFRLNSHIDAGPHPEVILLHAFTKTYCHRV